MWIQNWQHHIKSWKNNFQSAPYNGNIWKVLVHQEIPRNIYIYFSLKAWYINPFAPISSESNWHFLALVDPGGIPWPHPPAPPGEAFTAFTNLPVRLRWTCATCQVPGATSVEKLKHVETMTSSLATEIWIMILLMKFWSLNRVALAAGPLNFFSEGRNSIGSHGGLNGVVRDLVGILNLANAVGGDAVLVSQRRGPNLPTCEKLPALCWWTKKHESMTCGSFLISTVHCIIMYNWH